MGEVYRGKTFKIGIEKKAEEAARLSRTASLFSIDYIMALEDL
jgi:hypothetical protein